MNGQTTSRLRKSRQFLALLLTPLALGCLADRPDRSRPDPLTGLPKRLPASDRPVSSTFNPERTNSAVLASAGPRGPEGTSGLSIRDSRAPESERSTTSAAAWTGTESRTATVSSTGARLGSAPPVRTGAAPGAAAGGTRVRTFEEAQQFLVARGVKWQDLQNTGDNDWKFSCSIASKQNPSRVRNYEATDKYGLIAMQKVIDQIIGEEQAR